MTLPLTALSKAENRDSNVFTVGFFLIEETVSLAFLLTFWLTADLRLSDLSLRMAFRNIGITFYYLQYNRHIISHMKELFKNGSSLFLRRQTSILSAAIIIMITFAASHLIGLLKTRLLISVFFGDKTSLLDVYYAAFVIPDTIFQLLVIGSLSAAFIPVFTRLLSKKDRDLWLVAGTSLNLVLAIFVVISLLIFVFANPLSRLIAPGFNEQQIITMTGVLRVMLVAQIFFSISGFMTGIIQSHQRFLIPAIAPILYNLGIIMGTLFLSPIMGIYGPAIGVVFGAFLHMAIQIPVAVKLGFRPIRSFNYRNPHVFEIFRLLPPRALALGIDQIEQLVAVILASLLSHGSLTMFNVARLLYALPVSLFGVTIGQAALPALSHLASEPDKKTFRRTLLDSLLQIVFMALPITIIFIVLRIPIVRLVFGAKSFPWIATITTGKLLAILCLSSIFSAVSQLVIRGFYALHDTKTPLVVGIAGAVLNTSITVLLVNLTSLGIFGLAVGISASSLIESIILFQILSGRIGMDRWSLSHFFTSVGKLFVTGLISGISLWIPMRLLDRFVFDTTRTIPLLMLTVISSAIGIAVYLLFSYLFHVEQLRTIFSTLSRHALFRKSGLSRTREPLIGHANGPGF